MCQCHSAARRSFSPASAMAVWMSGTARTYVVASPGPRTPSISFVTSRRIGSALSYAPSFNIWLVVVSSDCHFRAYVLSTARALTAINAAARQPQKRNFMQSILRAHHDLDALVLLIAERLVHLRRVVEARAVRDEERRVDLPLLDALHQRAHVVVHVRLSHLQRQPFGE